MGEQASPAILDKSLCEASGAGFMNQATARDQDLAPDPGWTQKVHREFRGGNSGTWWRAGQNRATERRIRHECERPSEEDPGPRLPQGLAGIAKVVLPRPTSVARRPVSRLIGGSGRR